MNQFTNEQILAANNNTQSEMIKELSSTIGQLHAQMAHDKSVIKSLSTYVQKLEQEKEAMQKDLDRLNPKPSEGTEEQNILDPKAEEEKPKEPKKQDGKNQGGDK